MIAYYNSDKLKRICRNTISIIALLVILQFIVACHPHAEQKSDSTQSALSCNSVKVLANNENAAILQISENTSTFKYTERTLCNKIQFLSDRHHPIYLVVLGMDTNEMLAGIDDCIALSGGEMKNSTRRLLFAALSNVNCRADGVDSRLANIRNFLSKDNLSCISSLSSVFGGEKKLDGYLLGLCSQSVNFITEVNINSKNDDLLDSKMEAFGDSYKYISRPAQSTYLIGERLTPSAARGIILYCLTNDFDRFNAGEQVSISSFADACILDYRWL